MKWYEAIDIKFDHSKFFKHPLTYFLIRLLSDAMTGYAAYLPTHAIARQMNAISNPPIRST